MDLTSSVTALLAEAVAYDIGTLSADPKSADEWVKWFVNLTYYVLSGLGMLVMVWGSIGSTVRFLLLKLRRRANFLVETDRIRMWLGSHLLLGLDLLIGADVVKTIGGAEWDKVGILGAIVVIRVVLSHFLIQEMDHARRTIQQIEAPGLAPPADGH